MNRRKRYYPDAEVQAEQHWLQVYRCLCLCPQYAPANADVWDVRSTWPERHEHWLREACQR